MSAGRRRNSFLQNTYRWELETTSSLYEDEDTEMKGTVVDLSNERITCFTTIPTFRSSGAHRSNILLPHFAHFFEIS